MFSSDFFSNRLGMTKNELRTLFFLWCLVASSLHFVQAQDEESTPLDVISRNLVTEKVTYTSVLKENTKWNIENPAKNFAGTTLGYVTPWNNHGYDVVKTLPLKFDLISPTWFNMKPPTGSNSFVIEGDHNVDSGWLQDIADNAAKYGKSPKIVPRFLVDGWRAEDIITLTRNTKMETWMINTIISKCKQFNFNGIVLDTGYIGMRFSAEERPLFVNLLKQLADSLHNNNMILILVEPPHLSTTFFSSADFLELASFVDFFSIMTYDYPARGATPNSPISWVSQTVLSLVPPEHRANQQLTSKILIGLAFYGYDHHDQFKNPVLARDYLALLKKYKPKHLWDDRGHEHYVSFKEQVGTEHTVYFPTLLSINERLELASALGVGIAIWETGQGLDYWLDLL